MKNITLIALTVLGSLFLFGCSSGGSSDLSTKDKQDMDKLFREGIKNPPSNSGGTATTPNANQSKPLNAPADN